MRKLLVAALFASAVGLSGGTAVAEHCFDGDPNNGEIPPDWTCDIWHPSCGMNTVAQEDVTGGQDTFTGVAYGYAISQTGGNVSIRCYVSVDGSEVSGASTPTGTGVGVATTSGQITYTATEFQDVDLCAEWTRDGDAGVDCDETTTTQIPPQVVSDLIRDLSGIPDFLICPILAGLSPGVPGVVDIDSEGDVFVVGEWIWDCPPYES